MPACPSGGLPAQGCAALRDTALFLIDEIRCLSAAASSPRWVLQQMHIQPNLPARYERKPCLLSVSVWINFIYIGARNDKRSFLFFVSLFFFFPPTFFCKQSSHFCCVPWNVPGVVKNFNMHQWSRWSSTFKNTVPFFFFSLPVFFFFLLPLTTSPCAPWKSSRTWTETSRARPNAGRSLWSLSARKRRNSPRNGRTKLRFRDCAWWGPWGPTAWRTPSGENRGQSSPSVRWSVKDLLGGGVLTKGQRLNILTSGC